ncbi:MAG: HDIG domain-containing protein, partial [Candidatus Omnitrophica bacterium]|nr:HDIG domain-containing protein [Candidatus Omnitrophota bacterium]
MKISDKIKGIKGIKSIKSVLMKRETISIGLIVLFVAVVLSSMFVSPHLYQWSVHEGDISLKNVYAPYDFTYLWEIDEDKTREAMDLAEENVPYVLLENTSVEEKSISEMLKFIDIIKAEKVSGSELIDKVEGIKVGIEGEIADKALKALLQYEDLEELKKRSVSIINDIYATGYIAAEDQGYLKEKNIDRIVLLNEGTSDRRETRLKELLTEGSLDEVLEEDIIKEFIKNRKIRQPVAALVSMYLEPNLIPGEDRTEADRDAAVKAVKSVYKSWEVEKNELIVEKGKRVNACHITQLTQLRRFFRPGTTPTFFLGVLLLFLLLGLTAVIYMFFSRGKKNFLYETKYLAIVLLNMFFMVLIADAVMRSPQPSYFIPMASMAMILMLLLGFSTAFLGVVLMSVFISLLIGGGSEIGFVLLTGSVAGIFAVKGARRRANILWAGLLAGLVKFLAIVCIGLINGMDLDFYIHDGLWGIASGLFSGFIVMGLLPVFEYIFKVPTNISLLELSDLNHPLLKKLAMEAPGTYHHSIMVGNLAEAASDAIGADSLRSRVGAYYHDIGKIPKAEYFSENEMGSGSRHAKLTPSMSALIISKHVKEGVEIAKKYKLNTAIVDFITQHHGNSLIAYFYQKAIEKNENGGVLKEENFRYPGPRPQTKESAIVLLADAVEASSRT